MEAFPEASTRTEHIWQSHSHPSIIRFLRCRQTKIPMKSPRTAMTANTIPRVASTDKWAAPSPALGLLVEEVVGSVVSFVLPLGVKVEVVGARKLVVVAR